MPEVELWFASDWLFTGVRQWCAILQVWSLVWEVYLVRDSWAEGTFQPSIDLKLDLISCVCSHDKRMRESFPDIDVVLFMNGTNHVLVIWIFYGSQEFTAAKGLTVVQVSTWMTLLVLMPDISVLWVWLHICCSWHTMPAGVGFLFFACDCVGILDALFLS